jgi:hypothetical protein
MILNVNTWITCFKMSSRVLPYYIEPGLIESFPPGD